MSFSEDEIRKISHNAPYSYSASALKAKPLFRLWSQARSHIENDKEIIVLRNPYTPGEDADAIRPRDYIHVQGRRLPEWVIAAALKFMKDKNFIGGYNAGGTCGTSADFRHFFVSTLRWPDLLQLTKEQSEEPGLREFVLWFQVRVWNSFVRLSQRLKDPGVVRPSEDKGFVLSQKSGVKDSWVKPVVLPNPLLQRTDSQFAHGFENSYEAHEAYYVKHQKATSTNYPNIHPIMSSTNEVTGTDTVLNSQSHPGKPLPNTSFVPTGFPDNRPSNVPPASNNTINMRTRKSRFGNSDSDSEDSDFFPRQASESLDSSSSLGSDSSTTRQDARSELTTPISSATDQLVPRRRPSTSLTPRVESDMPGYGTKGKSRLWKGPTTENKHQKRKIGDRSPSSEVTPLGKRLPRRSPSMEILESITLQPKPTMNHKPLPKVETLSPDVQQRKDATPERSALVLVPTASHPPLPQRPSPSVTQYTEEDVEAMLEELGIQRHHMPDYEINVVMTARSFIAQGLAPPH